ncbi:P-loop containing nucleoside triphosphate hydrolase protein, partial [Rozella allomycis CSF55]
LKSITEQTNLEEFLYEAEAAEKDFVAEKQNIQVIIQQVANSTSISQEKERELLEKIENNKLLATVPRRSMSAKELHQLESQSFLEWRRNLAKYYISWPHNRLEEDYLMTPFEKNLDFWRQLWRVIERSDVLVQIVDARNPLLFRSPDLERYVKEVGEDKKNLLVLNKSDLLSKEQRAAWVEYFEAEKLDFVFFSATLAAEKLENADCVSEEVANDKTKILDAFELTEFFKNFSQQISNNSEQKTVGLIGYPNVGKSSTINAMAGEKKVGVAATPGKTKHFQTIILDSELCLLDCPGLVLPSFATTKAELVVNGILPVDQLRDSLGPS